MCWAFLCWKLEIVYNSPEFSLRYLLLQYFYPVNSIHLPDSWLSFINLKIIPGFTCLSPVCSMIWKFLQNSKDDCRAYIFFLLSSFSIHCLLLPEVQCLNIYHSYNLSCLIFKCFRLENNSWPCLLHFVLKW